MVNKTVKFESVIYQDENSIDVNRLFNDIEKQILNDKKELNLNEDERLDRTHPLQHIINSTSGGYIAPTSMKSFDACPAGYLYNKLVKEETGTATSLGHTFHSIMEAFYNLEGPERNKANIYDIMDKISKEDGNGDYKDDFIKYINGYLESPDYLNPDKYLDNKNLECSSEVFIKNNIKPLGVEIPVPIYLKIDRIDIREDGNIYVIDYKTGFGDPNPYLLGENGYLPQMIFYKWGVEAEYGQEVEKVLLSLPGADNPEYRYVELNANSLVEQSKVIEQVFRHLDYNEKIISSKLFEEKSMRYCNSCQMKYKCRNYIKSRNLEDKNVIPEKIDVSITYDLEIEN